MLATPATAIAVNAAARRMAAERILAHVVQLRDGGEVLRQLGQRGREKDQPQPAAEAGPIDNRGKPDNQRGAGNHRKDAGHAEGSAGLGDEPRHAFEATRHAAGLQDGEEQGEAIDGVAHADAIGPCGKLPSAHGRRDDLQQLGENEGVEQRIDAEREQR